MAVHSRPVSIKERTLSFPSILLALYNLQLYTHPLRTKAITAGILTGLQEFLAQELSGTKSKRKGKAKEDDKLTLYDVIDERVAKLALYGFFISGPLNHGLFEILNRIFKNRTGSGVKFLQILVTLLIILPIQNTVYLAAMAYITGMRAPEQILTSIKKSLLPIMKMTWIVFPIVQTFAQKFLDPPLWVPFFNLVGFSLGLYASTKAKIKQRKLSEDDQ
ncbi:16264_t:CDS:2 [Dentiscutata erythropus]|uniref:16264_t:CDS:1 n=1 Tax=Dentiscutata erythropus TaxID=1348616 RepID=A0A9N9BWC6_9GLOM|nr:16264_t:CDS:2 [Dentiscutata erythropus]